MPKWDELLDFMRVDRWYPEDVADDLFDEHIARVSQQFLQDKTARADSVADDGVKIDGILFSGNDPVAVEARKRHAEDQEKVRHANRAILTAWVNEHGTDNQRQRLAAGFLPWEEAYDSMKEHLYAPLAKFRLYERFTLERVCQCLRVGEDACKVKYRSVDATSLTADEWELYSRIRAAMPDASFQLREHTAECVSAEAPALRRGVIVKVAVEPLTFKREYALS